VKDKRKKKRGEKIADALQFPKEVILSMPCVKVLGDSEITIENYGGIIDYTEKTASFTTSMGIIEIRGDDFSIKSITDDDVILSGRISGFEIKEM